MHYKENGIIRKKHSFTSIYLVKIGGFQKFLFLTIFHFQMNVHDMGYLLICYTPYVFDFCVFYALLLLTRRLPCYLPKLEEIQNGHYLVSIWLFGPIQVNRVLLRDM